MKEITYEDLINLKHGDVVYQLEDYELNPFKYVGRAPGFDEHYFIFSCDANFVRLYANPDTKVVLGRWFIGEYSNKFVGWLLIKEHEKEIENLKERYF